MWPKLVVFDVDGTLAETREAVSRTVNGALRAHELPRVAPEFIHRMMGLPLEALFQRMIPPTLKPYDVAPLVGWYRRAFDELGGPLVAPMPGADALISTLAERGMPMALATSRGGPSLAVFVEAFGWTGKFVSIVTCERVSNGKPAPDTLALALQEAGVAASDAVMVGDTVWDMQMAVAAGVRAWGVDGGCHAGARLLEAGAESVLPDLAAFTPWLDSGV